MALTYQLISAQTLGSSAASITFSSIPGTYTDLELRYSARNDLVGNTWRNHYIRFNGDSSALYSMIELYGTGASAATFLQSGQTSIFLDAVNANGNTANTFTNNSIYISNYTSSANKQVTISNVTEQNAATAYSIATAGLYRNTSAITSLTMFCNTDNFITGSTFYLYGIKNS